MPAYKYPVTLSPVQRERAKIPLSAWRQSQARTSYSRARILLLADQNRPQGAIASIQMLLMGQRFDRMPDGLWVLRLS